MKVFLGTVACLFLVTSVWAIDYAMILDNDSVVEKSDSFSLIQQDTVSVWLSMVNSDSNFRIEGFYQFQGGYQPGQSAQIPYRFDVKELAYQKQFSGLFGFENLTTLKAGRFEFDDTSGRILNGTSDGFSIREGISTLELTLDGGYTGLIAEQDANVSISPADVFDYEGPSNTPYFAPKRIFVRGKAQLLELVPRHDLTLELIGQHDLRPAKPVDTGYAELSAEGRPVSWFKWRTYMIGESWSDRMTVPSVAAGARTQLSFPELSGLIGVANLEWASGSNDWLRAFAGISQRQIAQISPEVFANSVTGSLDVMVRVMDGLNAGLIGYGLFRASDQAPTDPLFPATATARYLGTEALAIVNYAYSDEIAAELKGGAFFPNTAADAYGASASARWLGALDLKVMF